MKGEKGQNLQTALRCMGAFIALFLENSKDFVSGCRVWGFGGVFTKRGVYCESRVMFTHTRIIGDNRYRWPNTRHDVNQIS